MVINKAEKLCSFEKPPRVVPGRSAQNMRTNPATKATNLANTVHGKGPQPPTAPIGISKAHRSQDPPFANQFCRETREA